LSSRGSLDSVVNAPEGSHPHIVAVIPALNESDNIANILSEVVPLVEYVILIDDGSTDETAKKAEAFAKTKVLRNKRNLGKGASLRRGFVEALKHNPDILITIDADGQHDPKDIPKLIVAMNEQDADIVIGSRYTKGSANEDCPRIRQLGLSLINRVNRSIVRSAVSDTSSGFRAYKRNTIHLLLDLDTKGYGYEFEQLAKAESHGLHIAEVPVNVRYTGLRITSKKNSVLLGANIVSTLLRIAVERRPMIYFGLTGIILTTVAAVTATQMLYLFNESRYFSIPLALVTLGFGLTGLVLVLISFVFQTMKKIRSMIQSSYDSGRY
jgi:glycosyltransferase involved in cell wall biosynthesis